MVRCPGLPSGIGDVADGRLVVPADFFEAAEIVLAQKQRRPAVHRLKVQGQC